MESISFKKHDYIRNYKLTLREFYLMGPELQIAYCDKVCGHYVDRVKNVGNKIIVPAYIPVSRFAYYFRKNGCELDVKVDDVLGTTTTIQRVNHAVCKPTEEAKQLLHDYRCKLAFTKAQIIQELLIDYFTSLTSNLKVGQAINVRYEDIENILTTFESDVLSTIYMGDELPSIEEGEKIIAMNDASSSKLSKIKLSEDQLNRLLEAELSMSIRPLEQGNEDTEITLTGSIDMVKAYCDYLRSKNYQVSQENTKAIVRKLISK